jgi:uncharacterized LabA/DUF88 family protein
MTRREQDIVDRLGPRGLTRALDDLLDQAKLVRLANACGLTYPGMRTRTQKRGKLVDDLSKRAAKEAATRRAVVRALRKEAAPSAKEWAGLEPGARASRVADAEYLSKPGILGRLLFVVADDGDAAEHDGHLPALRKVAEDDGPEVGARRTNRKVRKRPAPSGADGDPDSDRARARLAKQVAELRKKTQYLDGQLRKAREAEKSLKRDLMERRGELAEARMRIERLRKEVAELRKRPEKDEESDRNDRLGRKIESVARAVRKLATEHRHLAKDLQRLAEVAGHDHGAETRAETAEAIHALRKETASLRRAWKKDRDASGARMDELAASIRSLGTGAEPANRDPRRRRSTGANARVGVFVDVQNVYYGARQLKGKLDFDALLQTAAGNRRLILAQAYVVESKEIDQSGFIARLEQRAIQVRRKTLQVRADGSMKGDWDMEMALDILDAAPALDVVVLVSGDGDFTSLVTRVKALGPRVEVMGFPRNTANSLHEAADRFVPLDRKFMIRTSKD